MPHPKELIVQETLFANKMVKVCRAQWGKGGQSVILRSCKQDHPSDELRARFIRNQEILSKFNHPSIVKSIGLVDSNVQLALIMEDIGAVDLNVYRKAFPDQQLPIADFIDLAIQVADALSAVHKEMVIHKDLHPGNIIINPDTGRVQIIDFGLASLLSREHPALAPPDQLQGLLPYISPEQTGRMNRLLDYRTDFYSIGVIFYELLTGKQPFIAADAMGLVHAHIAQVPKPASSLRRDIPDMISAILDKLLAKTAEQRYQSGVGLKHDLEICRRQLKLKEPIVDFKLGVSDVSDKLQIPQTLYGRESDTKQLMDCYAKAAEGTPQILAVEGYSGIGKSVLIHEVHKPIAANNGVFIAGKFDKFQRNIPYSAFKQALDSWIEYALSLSDRELESLREHLKSRLGDNCRVLVDFHYNFKTVLGEFPPLAYLGAQESQNRLFMVLQRFLEVVTQHHPLVLFIDDVQWADRGTISLLPVLMAGESEVDTAIKRRLMIVVAYRSNEVDASHPVRLTLDGIKQLETIHLSALSIDEIICFLKDSLHLNTNRVEPLAKLISDKTAGNPFFIVEFIKNLYASELLLFDSKSQAWQWDIVDIEKQSITDNVVSLMLKRMQGLPEKTQFLLRRASCIGSFFDLTTLALICEQSVEVVAQGLWSAMQEGVLLQESGDWLYGAVALAEQERGYASGINFVPAKCKFLHDRMLQAAYQSLEKTERCQSHLKIGRLMVSQKNWQSQFSIFDVAEQFNQGLAFVSDNKERLKIAELNHTAAQRSLESSVWTSAIEFATSGLVLLPENAWQECHDLKLGLQSIVAEACYLSGRLEESERYYEDLLANTTSQLEKARTYLKRLVQSIGVGAWLQGIEFGVQGLSCLALVESSDAGVNKDGVYVNCPEWVEEILSSPPVGVASLAKAQDEEIHMALSIIANVAQNSYIVGEKNFGHYFLALGLKLMTSHGRSAAGAVLLSHLASMFFERYEFDKAVITYHQALPLLDDAIGTNQYSNAINVLSRLTMLDKPFSESIEMHKKGFEMGMENGELVRAIINKCNSIVPIASKGEPLATVDGYAENAQKLIEEKGVFFPAVFAKRQLMRGLMYDDTNVEGLLGDHVFSAKELQIIKSSFHHTLLVYCRFELSFWKGEYDVALGFESQMEKLKSVKLAYYYDFCLLHAIALMLSSKEKENQSLLLKCLDHLGKFADIGSDNFRHQYCLARAEYESRAGSSLDVVVPLYEEAIQAAKKNGFLQYEALGNERFGEFWLLRGNQQIGNFYIESAIGLYQKWGCVARVNYLYRQHPDLILRDSSEADSTSGSSAYSLSSELDLSSIIKSAQAISEELDQERLIVTVMKVMVENAGAHKGALVLYDSKGGLVRSVVQAGVERDFKPIYLEQCEELPVSVVNYVMRSKKHVQIQDVENDAVYSKNAYLTLNKVKSVLCLPMSHREKLVGVLYLENNLINHAFPEARINVLVALLRQAAISLENARLFSEVQDLNRGLEQKVLERTDELASTNKNLNRANEELKAFSYSVSHDLRGPLRIMKGFSDVVLNDYRDKLDDDGVDYLQRIVSGADRMTALVNSLLDLSRVNAKEVILVEVDLSTLAKDIIYNLRQKDPERVVDFECADNVRVKGDKGLLLSLMENLLSNAWKYTSKSQDVHIEFGKMEGKHGQPIYFVKDNGCGFDMQRAGLLFGAFQRLHQDSEFEGTGVGLATAKRILTRLGGEVWVEAALNKGATFYFTLSGNK